MTLPHKLLDTALKIKAIDYVASLYPGATVDANDRRYLKGTKWGRFLNTALAERGWMLDGDIVVPLLRMAAE